MAEVFFPYFSVACRGIRRIDCNQGHALDWNWEPGGFWAFSEESGTICGGDSDPAINGLALKASESASGTPRCSPVGYASGGPPDGLGHVFWPGCLKASNAASNAASSGSGGLCAGAGPRRARSVLLRLERIAYNSDVRFPPIFGSGSMWASRRMAVETLGYALGCGSSRTLTLSA